MFPSNCYNSVKGDDTVYKINDLIQYGTDGVCRITQITEREFRGRSVRYYVLNPVFNDRATLFVPVDNEALVSRMRYALSADEITSIVRDSSNDCLPWIENEAERRQRFKEIIGSGKCADLVRVIRTLYLHQQDQKAAGKRMHMSDERLFRDAERIFNDEYAVALGISPDEVVPHIRELMES